MHIVLQLGSAAVYTATNCLTQGHATSADFHFCQQNCYNAVLIRMISLLAVHHLNLHLGSAHSSPDPVFVSKLAGPAVSAIVLSHQKAKHSSSCNKSKAHKVRIV